MGIIERATERLTTKAEAHRERAQTKADLAPDLMAFDDSPVGERLRRFELASGRALARSLEELRRHRNSSGQMSMVGGPLSVVSGPLSIEGCEVGLTAEQNTTNEPTIDCENVTNESGSSPLSVVRCPLLVVGDTVASNDEPNATNGPNDSGENVTNEAKLAGENATNESGSGPLSVVHCPLLVIGDTVASNDQPNATNEPNHAGENVTNEAKLAGENATNEAKLANESEGGQTTDHGPLTTDIPGQTTYTAGQTTDHGPLITDIPEPGESFEQGVARRKAAREEMTRKLNEEARREAALAMAARRAYRACQTNGKARARLKARAAPGIGSLG